MKSLITAVAIGVATEAGLIAALVGSGFGPCGPAAPVGAFVLALHTPGLWLMSAMHIPESVGLWIVMATYAATWTGLSLLVLTKWWR